MDASLGNPTGAVSGNAGAPAYPRATRGNESRAHTVPLPRRGRPGGSASPAASDQCAATPPSGGGPCAALAAGVGGCCTAISRVSSTRFTSPESSPPSSTTSLP